MRVPPLEYPTCASFEEYKEVPETVPLYFSEDDVMGVVSGALVAEVIELRNWILSFGCVSEDFRVFVNDLAEWIAKS